ncbi:hypothetical protein [uncultured Nitrosomonas sp.]|uniref:hypothetical protein n=1 Tax=uncultured Nitrosomonas sp. TaxID=156424 RepID=UPI0025DDBAB5|nr:hypothetical protein [uncultured Nitrosomonas sp.]
MNNCNNSAHIPPIMTEMIFIVSISILVLTGCTTVETRSTVTPQDIAATACRALYQEIDATIDNVGVRDYGSSLIEGFPYLRTTRLLASFSHELNDKSPQWLAWVAHMTDLDAQSRALELRNLPSSVLSQPKDTLLDELNKCRDLLISIDLTNPQQRTRLRDIVHVPDDYVTWWQTLGLYPLTAPVIAVGISEWHRKTHEIFAIPFASLPVAGKLIRWVPISNAMTPGVDALLSDQSLTAQQISGILYRSLDPLGIPMPEDIELDQLFNTFAPIWEVDVADDNDRIGKIHLENGPSVDIARPTFYRKVSHTRSGQQVLLQLNYIVWFPARSGSDIYAGRLDGINWRVTLGPDGKPWLYDVIHNCGCYHKFFLSHQLRLRKDLPLAYFESPLLPQSAPEQQSLVLRIAHHTHFIQRIYSDNAPNIQSSAIQENQPLLWEDYDELRSLPSDEGYRSLFGKYGLVAGTERSERFLFWPMGIRSPGAMRQWGRHATAFNGRRHFDDAFLIESLFERTP